MRVGEPFLQALDRRVAKVVVVIVRDDNNIHSGQILQLAWRRCEALQAFEVDGRAAVLKHRVE